MKSRGRRPFGDNVFQTCFAIAAVLGPSGCRLMIVDLRTALHGPGSNGCIVLSPELFKLTPSIEKLLRWVARSLHFNINVFPKLLGAGSSRGSAEIGHARP